MKNNNGKHGKNKCGHFRCNQGNRGLLCQGKQLVKQDPYYSMFDNASNFAEQIQEKEEIINLDTELDILVGNDSKSPSITYERRLELVQKTNDVEVLENIYFQSTEENIKQLVIENKYITALLLGKIYNKSGEPLKLRVMAQKKYQAKVLSNIFGF